MIVSAKNLQTGNEVNIVILNLVMFEPASDPSNSVVHLANGLTLTVDVSCEGLRNAVHAASQIIE